MEDRKINMRMAAAAAAAASWKKKENDLMREDEVRNEDEWKGKNLESEWPPKNPQWQHTFTPADAYHTDIHKFRVTNFLTFNAAPVQQQDLPQIMDKKLSKEGLTNYYYNWHTYKHEHVYSPTNLEVYVDPTVYVVTLTNMTADGVRDGNDAEGHDRKVIYEYEHNVYVFSPYMIDTVVDAKSHTNIQCMIKTSGSALYHLHSHIHNFTFTHSSCQASEEKAYGAKGIRTTPKDAAKN